MQKLHCCGLDIIAWIRDKFSAILSDELIHEGLTRSGGGNPSIHVISHFTPKQILSESLMYFCPADIA
jgi:hypothetical protein